VHVRLWLWELRRQQIKTTEQISVFNGNFKCFNPTLLHSRLVHRIELASKYLSIVDFKNDCRRFDTDYSALE